MKLMLVGQGNVGKTSLLTALQSKSGKRKKVSSNATKTSNALNESKNSRALITWQPMELIFLLGK